MRTYSSILLVAAQFACLLVLFLTGPIFAGSVLLRIIEIAGLALGAWAVATMGLGKFNIRPDVPVNGRFVASGPYKFIRHPMYTSVLLTTLPLVVDMLTMVRISVWGVLLGVLLVKLRYEENLLAARFPNYGNDMADTKRLIPLVW